MNFQERSWVECYEGERLEKLKRKLRKQVMDAQGFKDMIVEYVDPDDGTKRLLRTTCPNCGRTYKPKYERKEDAPENTIWREQHLTGICCDKCWDEFCAGMPPHKVIDFGDTLLIIRTGGAR